MGFFDFIGEAAQWAADRIDDAEQWVEQRADDVGDWFSDLYHGNLGDQAVPAPALVQKIIASQGAQSWHEGSETAKTLARMHDEGNDLVRRISSGLESSWTGSGADAAQARIRPFAEALTSSAQITSANSDNVSEIAHSFDEMKSSLQPMPPAPPHKNFFDQASPWDTDTERQINEYNAVAKDNVAQYQAYARHIETKAPNLNANYTQLSGFGEQDFAIDSHGTSAQAKTTDGQHSHAPDSNARRSQSGATSGPASPPAGQGTMAPPSGSVAPPLGHQAAAPPGDGTTSAGWAPPSSVVNPGGMPSGGGNVGNGASPWAPGAIEFDGMGTGARAGVGSGRGAYEGLGGRSGESTGGGRNGGGGNNSGNSGNAGGRYGSGNNGRAGGARFGAGIDAGEEAVGRGAATGRGAAGARGAAGMGGMGAGGKGKGEEDKEHQRKYGIDDDSAFTLVDDEGERVLDPRTGLPPTPPTIGG
ncbi:hypothetical protein [Amycolatopsis panacis]|uniref:PPE domain-containing protein n=1 Tax=Amycolatopsis panacis TaxID=2340917 RepID=A0A419HKH7_9PSEU|nr:hypothetical protein [Amycolatopsis panacis]RJQ76452.1 hypothetical protein D5S19_30525 [Amycolatopsis panacis]